MNEPPRPPRNRTTSGPSGGPARSGGRTGASSGSARGTAARRPSVKPPQRAAGGRRTPPNGRPRPAAAAARRRKPTPRREGGNPIARWLPVGAAAGLLAVVVGVGMAGGSDDGNAAPLEGSLPGVVVPGSSATTAAPTTVPADAVATVPTSAPVDKVPLANGFISAGMYGPDVEMVQQRLTDLGFDPGPVDGAYGTMSQQAVWAFKKLVMGVPREDVTSDVNEEVWSRMQDPIQIAPRRPTGGLGDHVEIYLTEQVMVVFHQDVPALVTHISSGQLNPDGTPFEYHETLTIDTDINGNPLEEPETKPIVGWAYTPPGVFKVYRYEPDTHTGPLGAMWNPIYINQGIAIHGARNVPKSPASHGCIRVPMHISEYLFGVIEKGDKVLIWGYDGRQPEDYNAQERQMIWDRLDPTATTTTTSTTVAPTTTEADEDEAPETTARPTTTTQAPTTTTQPATTTTQPATTTTQAPAPPTVPPVTAAP